MARLLLLLALLSCVFCEDVPEPPSLDDLRKLRIPELKKFLMVRHYSSWRIHFRVGCRGLFVAAACLYSP